MSQTPRSFRPGELDGADRRVDDAELAAASAMAHEIEASLPGDFLGPTAAFGDRVMAAIALEPAPRPAGFLTVLRARPGLAGLVASVREAWAVVGGGPGRPIRARGLALAYVFAILVIGTSLTGAVGYGAAGALGFLDGDNQPTPTLPETVEPSPSLEPDGTPTPSPSPTVTPAPTESIEPSESPDPDESTEPDASDDHGGSTPGSSDDGGSSPAPSQDDDDSALEPSDTPRPSDTPKPSQTPS
ncbi:MAG: hypothetical protein EPO36_02160 [Chloroflexota bacterium]|nr:MAG: hypothetical protein EPO36_02160 [Chloroflexota bacterium]